MRAEALMLQCCYISFKNIKMLLFRFSSTYIYLNVSKIKIDFYALNKTVYTAVV